ncbi:MAG: hypothetical protein Q7R47_04165 [Candidatus Diapherotrites archaeon]|nr:hypothetical protein [Candidatus Diapherotrites archaeon]
MNVAASRIRNPAKCALLARQLARQPKNILIFGLPDAGKTTLADEIRKQDPTRKKIDEWSTDADTRILQTEQDLVATSQYRTATHENTPDEIRSYLKQNGLVPAKWQIVLIRKDSGP